MKCKGKKSLVSKYLDLSNLKDVFEIQKILINNAECIIIDVGAHYGETIKKYREIFPNCTIFSFEPHIVSFNILNDKYYKDKKIYLNNIAISNYVGISEFFCNYMDATNSLFPREKKGRRYFPQKASTKEIQKVQVCTLDNYCDNNSIDKIDILKMDIQGSELSALQGAESLLKTNQISIIYTEAFFIPHYAEAPLFHHIAAYLEKFDYTLYGIYNLKSGRNGQLRYGDMIFTGPEVRENIINNFPQEE